MHVVGIRLPITIVNLVDRIADRQLRSRSDVLRALAIESLQHRGLVETAGAVLDAVEA